MKQSITSIIVTYNRKALLINCLSSVVGQTHPPDHILIVDNASTDGTDELLQIEGWLERPDIELLVLDCNIGGAGGFATGLAHAIRQGAKWIWMMDDDGYPAKDCLALLWKAASIKRLQAISPIQVDISNHTRPAFPTKDALHQPITRLPFVPANGDSYIPNDANLFNGLLVHSSVVEKIGLPRSELFIRGDEVEFTRRMRNNSIPFGSLTSAFFYHPSDSHERFKILGGLANARDAGNDFKNYYMFRNKALAFRENHQLWLLPFDAARYVYYFLIHKRGDFHGLNLWFRAMRDGLAKKLGRHPDY